MLDSNNIDAMEIGIVPYGSNKVTTYQDDYHNGLLYNVHPNDAGNFAIANIVYKVLKQLYL